MVNFDDMLTAKYKPFGRGPDVYDCYGYVLELCHRTNQHLKDIAIDWKNKSVTDTESYLLQLNVIEIDKPEKNCIVQTDYNNELHIGFVLDRAIYTHMTYQGPRVSPLGMLKKKKFYRVIDEGCTL